MSIFLQTWVARAAFMLGLAATSAAISPARADDQVVRFGVAAEPYPPFTNQEASGKWVGFEIELMDAICKAEHLKCEIVSMAFDGMFAALNDKKFDVLWTSVGITDERKKIFDFTDKYYDTPTAIVVSKSAPVTITAADLSALKGKTFGVQASTIYARFLDKYLPGRVTVKTYDSQDNANADLAAGRVDVGMCDAVLMSDWIKSDAGKDFMIALTIPSSFDRSVLGYGVGGGVRKSDTALKQTINDGIKAIRADGTYDRIAKTYFNFNVYGD